MKLTIKTWLIGLLSSLVCCIGVIGLVTTGNLKASHNDLELVGGRQLPIVRSIGDIKYALTRYRLRVVRTAETVDPEGVAKNRRDLGLAQKDIDASIAEYHKLTAGDPEQAAMAETFDKQWRTANEWHEKVLDLGAAGHPAEAVDLFGAESKTTFDATIKTLNQAGLKANSIADMAVAKNLANYRTVQILSWTAILAGLALGALGFILLFRQVTGPIQRIIAVMKALAAGDLSVEIPFTTTHNELGDMARTLTVFRDSLREAEALRRDQSVQAEMAARQRTEERIAMADQFHRSVGALAQAFVSSSQDLEVTARTLSGTAGTTSRKVEIVTQAAADASENVTTVAAGTDELTASIREINSQVTRASGMAGDAADEAFKTDRNIRELSSAAQKIGDVVALIQAIASQTNLLALNATIEAARAGEAGKGFAVVASEVKSLAQQTARATDEISVRIGEIQSATDVAVASISSIVARIETIREVTTAIAGAVEEQGAATAEIAHNTRRAAAGTHDVTGTIADVGQAVDETGQASGQLLDMSASLSRQSDRLKAEVDAFVDQLRVG